MNFICYTDWSQLPDSADALFARGALDSIFLTRQWFEQLSETGLNEGEDLALACVLVENRVVAILPLLRCAGNSWMSLRHRYTPVFSLLLAETDRQRTLDCLARGLAQLPLRALVLEPVAETDDRIAGLQRAMEGAGFNSHRRFRLYNWVHRVGGQSFAEYLAARPARLRNTIARKRRRLEREHGCVIRLYIGDEVPAAMSEYHAVYRASWKAHEQYEGFLDAVVSAFSAAGWTRLAVLYVGERPIAAQLWFVVHGRASIFRLAYDNAWKQYSPGSILTGFLMEYVMDTDRVEEIDFLTGNDAYKQDWMSERRERFALSFVRDARQRGWYGRMVEFLKGLR